MRGWPNSASNSWTPAPQAASGALDNGYCLMVGGSKEVASIMQPALQALAPARSRLGARQPGRRRALLEDAAQRHRVRNDAALAEGLDLLKNKKEFTSTSRSSPNWRHGSVVRSWLLDLTADALKNDQELAAIAPHVSDSGEGRWTVIDSVEQGVAAPVPDAGLADALCQPGRHRLRQPSAGDDAHAFGGHAIKRDGN